MYNAAPDARDVLGRVTAVSQVPVGSKRSRRFVFSGGLSLVLMLGVVLLAVAPALAAPVKLSSSMVSGGALGSSLISADSRTVVYVADQDTDGVNEVYSVPSGGGSVTKLNGPMASGAGGVTTSRYKISADSSTVVYRADQATAGVRELYSVPIGGGTVTKLSGTIAVSGTGVQTFEISADSSRVVYLAWQDTEGVSELYSVPIGGGTVTKLNGSIVASGTGVSSYALSADGSRVVYMADQAAAGVVELYSVPIGGGTPIKLNGTLVSSGNVSWMVISPDSGRVVYRADQETDAMYELYSVSITGGTVTKLNGTLVASGDVWSDYLISPDSSRVVYYADQEADTVSELYSVPIGGGTATKLNGPIVPATGSVSGFAISADGNRVVYRADQETDDVFELYSVPIGGGTVTKLNGAIVPAGGDVLGGFVLSADSSRVVYRADQETDAMTELYSVPITGGTVTKLNGTLVSGGNVVSGVVISANSRHVLYVADQETDGTFELYDVPLAGGTARKLNDTLAASVSVSSVIAVSSNSAYVVYQQSGTDVSELYSYGLGAAPELVAFSPARNAQDVAVDSTVVLTYTHEMSATTVTSRTVAVHSMMHGMVPAAPGTAGNVVTVIPEDDFFPGELVYGIGTAQVANITGTHPLTPTVWQFNARVDGGYGNFAAVPVDFGTSYDRAASVAWGDWDGDGDLDLLVGSWADRNYVYLNEGGTFGASVGFGGGMNNTTAVAWGDYDGDGDLDVAVGNSGQQNYVYPNLGGFFDWPVTVGTLSDATKAIAWGDFDGDGDLDLAVGNSGTQSAVFLNEDGTFANDVPFGAADAPTSAVAWGDFDNDGDLDLAVGNDGQQNVIYLNDGAGGFSGTVNFGTGSDHTVGLAWADFDADGDLDLAMADSADYSMVSLNDGSGGFWLNVLLPAESDSARAVAWGDWDGDGDLDLAVAYDNKPQAVYPNAGGGSFGTAVRFGGNLPARSVAWGDFDADGDVDLAVGVMSAQSGVYLNEPTPSELAVTKWAEPALDVDYHGVVTYTVVVSNTGGLDAPGALLTDTLPAGVEFARWLEQSDAAEANGVITWTGTVSVGEVVTWTWTVTHTGMTYGETITNTAEAWNPVIGVVTEGAGAFTVKGSPEFEIAKTVEPRESVDYHGVVTYTVTVTNSGPSPALAFAMVDPLVTQPVTFAHWIAQNGARFDDSLTGEASVWYSDVLTNGATMSWSWAVTHTGDYGDVVENEAGCGDEIAGTSALVTTTFTVKGGPELVIAKSAEPATNVDYHGVVTYTLAVTNSGESPAASVMLTDALPLEVDFAEWYGDSHAATVEDDEIHWSGDIAVGQVLTWTWTVTYTGDAYGETITNTGQVRNPVTGAVTEGAGAFTVKGPPAFAIVKTVEPRESVDYHGVVTYTVTVTNSGPSPSRGATMIDPFLTQPVTFAHWIAQNGATISDTMEYGPAIVWNNTIDSGASMSWGWAVTHTGRYGDAVRNDVWITDSVSSADATAHDTFTVREGPQLSIFKSAMPASAVDYNGLVTYTVTLANSGLSPAPGVVVTDALPADVEFGWWVEQNGAEMKDDELRWSGDVAAGHELTFAWTVTHTGMEYGATITNTAWYDWDGETEGYTAIFTVKDPPEFELSKTAVPAIVDYHGTVTYTLSVTNSGPSLAEVGTLVDLLPLESVTFSHWITQNGAAESEGLIVWLGPITAGARLDWSWVVTHVGDYADVVTNTADIIDMESGAMGHAEAAFTVDGPPVLILSKEASPENGVDFHGVVTYSVQLTNMGEADAAGALLTDTLPAGVEFGQWVNQNGAAVDLDRQEITWNGIVTGTGHTPLGQVGWSWTVTHTGDYGDVITNTVEAVHPESAQHVAAEAGFAVKTTAQLVITKTVVPEEGVEYHGPAAYTVVLYNTGETDALGALVTDVLPAEVEFADWLQQNGATETNGTITWSGVVTANEGIGWSWLVTHTGDYGEMVTNTVEAVLPASEQHVAADAVFTVKSGPVLAVWKGPFGWSGDVDYHGVVTYALEIENTGESIAQGVYMTDILPANVTFGGWLVQNGAQENHGTLSWSGTVSDSASVAFRFAVTHTGGYGEWITNTAQVEHWFAGSEWYTDTAWVKTAPELEIRKAVEPLGSVHAGDLLTYTIEIENSGESNAVGTSLSDTLPGGVDFSAWVRQNGASLEGGRVISWYGTCATGTTEAWEWVTQYAHSGQSLRNVAEFWWEDQHGSAEASPSTLQYLPLVMKNFVMMPDLVIDAVEVRGDVAEVVIRNAGNQRVVDDFWVDLSFNPSTRPPRINQPWSTIAAHGLVWGVIADNADLDPGQTVTLYNDATDPFFWGPPSSSSPPLPVGQDVYVYVDSVDWATDYGAVRESDERNNTFGPVVSASDAGAGAAEQPPLGARTVGSLPRR